MARRHRQQQESIGNVVDEQSISAWHEDAPNNSKGTRSNWNASPSNQLLRVKSNRELLLDGLELIGTHAANGAHEVLGQLGGVNLDLVTANGANELVGLVSHDGSFQSV